MSALKRCPSEKSLLRVSLSEMDEALLAHLERCPECAARIGELRCVAEVGRALPGGDFSAARERAIRDTLLARAGASKRPTEQTSRPRWLVPAFAGAAVLALALVVLAPRWISPAPELPDSPAESSPVYHATVHAESGARFVRLGGAPDEIVRLYEGTITVEVDHLSPGERFRVLTNDGEVEVRGTVFEVRAEADRLQGVRVLRGRVVVTPDDVANPVELAAGERWASPRLGQTAVSQEPVQQPEPVVEAAPLDPVRPTEPEQRIAAPERPIGVARTTERQPRTEARHTRHEDPRQAAETTLDAAEAPVARHSPTSTELRYQDGWGAMRAGDFSRAASAFEGVLGDPASPFAEDAAYWRAVALGRAHRSAEAAQALRDYVARYDGSARSAEAHAMLGWLLLDAGDQGGARESFEAAARSGVPRASESAERGLSRLRVSGGADERGRGQQ